MYESEPELFPGEHGLEPRVLKSAPFAGFGLGALTTCCFHEAG